MMTCYLRDTDTFFEVPDPMHEYTKMRIINKRYQSNAVHTFWGTSSASALRYFGVDHLWRFGILELRNWVTQNDVTLRVTNSKVFTEILLSSYLLDFIKYQIKHWVTNSKVSLLFFYFRVTNSKLKNKKFHFELVTRSRKLKIYTSS